MKRGFLLGKVVFMICIIIISSFSMSFVGEVMAAEETLEGEEATEEGDFACCEMTSAGDSCRYTSAENCDSTYNMMPGQSCEISTFCKVGCCISPSGVCTKQVSKATCEMHEDHTWDPDASCELEQCGMGCCVIGGASCMYETEKRCSSYQKDFPEAEIEFRVVDSESACTGICRESDKGCCVKDEGCSWTSRGTCGMEEGIGEYGFYKDVRCSDENFFDMCGCTPGEEIGTYGCLDDEDVHWIDSCGNDDGIKEKCDYASGTLCGHNEDNEAYCKSLDCETTTANVNIKTGDKIDDYTGGFRRNGESWCLYDGKVGPTADLVGSRHFMVMCENGEEVISSCRDYREEICVQGDLGTGSAIYRGAKCEENKEADCTTICNSQANLGEDTDEEQIEKAVKKDYFCCENEERNCYWTGEDKKAGACLPLIPKGGAFWQATKEDESDEESGGSKIYQQCLVGEKECNALWGKDYLSQWDFELEAGDECYEEEFFDNSLAYCRGIGDCGAHYNYVGEASKDGFRRDSDTPTASDRKSHDDWAAKAKRKVTEGDLGGFSIWAFAGNGLFGGATSLSGKDLVQAVISGDGITDHIDNMKTACTILDVVAGILMTIGGGGGALQVIAILLEVISLIMRLISMNAESRTITITTTCSPWMAPTGGEDCELCDQDPLKPCSEYRCRSLGQNCRFIADNEGSGRESCYAKEGSFIRPKISAWLKDDKHPLSVVSKRQNVEDDYDVKKMGNPEFIGGYKIEQEVPSYSRITIGIETDQLSQCKIAESEFLKDKLSQGITYNDLNVYMPDIYYSKKHNISISGLTPGKTFKYYILCRNPDGVPEEDAKIPPYVIEFTTDEGPDMTVPIITGFNVEDGGKVKAGTESFILSFYVDEVQPFSCKMSRQDQAYDFMEEEAGCASVEPDTYFDESARCAIELNLTQEGENTYYFRCKDEDGNENRQSTMLTLSVSKPLEISQSSPSGTLYTKNVTMQLRTREGADEGAATCMFDGSGCDMTFVEEFYETNAAEHMQRLENLPKCFYSFDITCRDSVGNYAYSNINFTLDVDTEAPSILSLYQSGTSISITLNELATCEYSSQSFSFGAEEVTGTMTTSHSLSGLEEYYFQCQDKFGNLMPEVIIRT